MTPVQKLKHIILIKDAKIGEYDLPEINEENVDDVFDDNDPYEAMDELREGEIETDIPSPGSRHYETKSVAARHPDGSWVGWTYWYGGGKHGNPEEIEWLGHAYALDVTEEEKLVIVRTFKKAE